MALVNEGWAFGELMAMPAREFGFWFGEQERLSRRRVEEAKRAGG